MEATPIMDGPMISVALDLFNMPKVQVAEKIYDAMAVCVDRHSGWIIAVPVLMKGLTAQKVALAMYDQWRFFGVPSFITTDRGPHFVGAWWETMCNCIGAKMQYAQAYRHRTNGRAEMAGQQLMEILRKLQNEERLTWVEMLPMVVDKLHDVPGITGLSPYEILFGRDRPTANIPFPQQRQCDSALRFFHQQKSKDERVARILNGIHAKAVERYNASQKTPEVFEIGDTVWFKRPENSGNKLDTRWIGPCKIVGRTGANSYDVQVKESLIMNANVGDLKRYIPDKFNGDPIPLFYHRRTVVDLEAAPDEGVVDRILGHRIDKDGKFWFKVKWEGFSESDATWEPVNHFFHRYSAALIAYGQRHGLDLNCCKFLSPEPMTG